MTRYILDPPGDMLQWLLSQDAYPHAVPVFPEQEDAGLVCAQLVGGRVSAEVIPSAEHLVAMCGAGFPLGRLYFQIMKSELYSVCPALTPDAWGEELG
jgi:hypothetical protein